VKIIEFVVFSRVNINAGFPLQPFLLFLHPSLSLVQPCWLAAVCSSVQQLHSPLLGVYLHNAHILAPLKGGGGQGMVRYGVM
jgi:hypothetical protein